MNFPAGCLGNGTGGLGAAGMAGVVIESLTQSNHKAFSHGIMTHRLYAVHALGS